MKNFFEKYGTFFDLHRLISVNQKNENKRGT